MAYLPITTKALWRLKRAWLDYRIAKTERSLFVLRRALYNHDHRQPPQADKPKMRKNAQQRARAIALGVSAAVLLVGVVPVFLVFAQ